MKQIDYVEDLEKAVDQGDGAAWLVSFIWHVFNELSHMLSELMAIGVLPLLGPVMALLFTIISLKLVMAWGDPREHVKEIFRISFYGAIGMIVLLNVDYLFDYLLYPLLYSGAKAGEFILYSTVGAEMQAALDSGAFTKSQLIQEAPIGEMVWMAGRQVDWIIFLGQRIVNGDGGVLATLNAAPRFIAAIPLVFGAFFLLGLFTAYTIEALYNYIVGAVMLPLAVVAYMVPKGRAYAGALFRLLLSGALLLILLSVAMGVTGRFVTVLEPVIITEITGVPATTIRAAELDMIIACRAEVDCEEATQAYEAILEADSISVFGNGYFLLLLSLLVSGMLHMRSKTLVSNLTGVNDGPGTGAAVAAVGSAGASAALGGAKWVALKGGQLAGSGIKELAGRIPTPFSYGGSNSSPENIMAQRRGGGERVSQPPPASPDYSSSPSSSGPSSGVNFSELNQTLKELIKTLKSNK